MSRTYNYLAGSKNGKINWSVDNVSGESVQYQYDSLNRLLTASTTAGPSPWGQSFTYDGFGNLTGKAVTQGSAPTLSVVVDPATNRAGGLSYDANGNQLQYAGHSPGFIGSREESRVGRHQLRHAANLFDVLFHGGDQ